MISEALNEKLDNVLIVKFQRLVHNLECKGFIIEETLAESLETEINPSKSFYNKTHFIYEMKKTNQVKQKLISKH